MSAYKHNEGHLLRDHQEYEQCKHNGGGNLDIDMRGIAVSTGSESGNSRELTVAIERYERAIFGRCS